MPTFWPWNCYLGAQWICDLISTGLTGSCFLFYIDVYYFIRKYSFIIFPSVRMCLNQLSSPNLPAPKFNLKECCLFLTTQMFTYSLLSNSINVNHLTPAFCVWAKTFHLCLLHHSDTAALNIGGFCTGWNAHTLFSTVHNTDSDMTVLCLLPACHNTSNTLKIQSLVYFID